MQISRLTIGGAALALGTMLAWGASPAVSIQPTTATTLATALQGRQRMSPADRAKAQVARIDKAVGPLSDDVKTKMEAIYEKAYTDSATAMQNGDRDQVRTINEQATKDAQALCTPDQVAKWPKPPARRGGGGGGGQ